MRGVALSSFVDLPSVLWYCWLGLLTCKNRLPYNLYCVDGDVKHCSLTHFIINTLQKKTFSTGAARKDDVYCALCSSAAAAVAIGQLQLQPSHYSLVALQPFCFPKCDFWGGLEGASKKNFLGSLSLAIFSGPLINYAIIRPLVSRTY